MDIFYFIVLVRSETMLHWSSSIAESHIVPLSTRCFEVLQQVPAIFSKCSREDNTVATLLFMAELTLHSSFLLAGVRCTTVNLGLPAEKKRTMVQYVLGISSPLELYNSSFCLASHDTVWYMEYTLKIAAVEVQKLLYYSLLIREQYQEKAVVFLFCWSTPWKRLTVMPKNRWWTRI